MKISNVATFLKCLAILPNFLFTAPAQAEAVTSAEALRVGTALCEIAAPLSHTGSRILSNRPHEDCMIAVVQKDIGSKKEVSKSKLYEMTLRICSKDTKVNWGRFESMTEGAGSEDFKSNCFARVMEVLRPDKNLAEAVSCKTSECYQQALTCEKDFEFMKYGVRNRKGSVDSTMTLQKKTMLQAVEQWFELSTMEVSAENVDTARACLRKTYDVYRDISGQRDVLEATRSLMTKLQKDFPEASSTPNKATTRSSDGATTR